jgi:tellurite resistance protein
MGWFGQRSIAMIVLWICLGLLTLGCLSAWAFLYLPYCKTPEKRWANKVLRLIDEGGGRLKTEKWELQRMRTEAEKEKSRLTAQAFTSMIWAVRVDELEAFPGIGPATVSRLREAGFDNLARLTNAAIHIHGLGAKRLADIHQAVQQLNHQARLRFDSGQCQEAATLKDELAEVEKRYQQQFSVGEARAERIERFLNSLHQPGQVAKSVTFVGYLGLRSKPNLPSRILENPLPDLEAALAAADERQRRTSAGYKHAVKGPAVERPVLAVPLTAPNAIPLDSKFGPAAPGLVLAGAGTQAAARAVPPPPTSPVTPVLIMDLTIQVAVAAARADGPVEHQERELIKAEIKQRYGYDQALMNQAQAFYAYYETGKIDLGTCLGQIKERFGLQARLAFLQMANKIMELPPGPNAQEAAFLHKVCGCLGVDRALLPKLGARKKEERIAVTENREIPTRTDHLSVLEIDPKSALSANLIRRQYNRLSERFTPEKTKAMGPEFVALAEEKKRALLIAAQALLAPLGESLEVPAPVPTPKGLRDNPDLDAVFGA